MLSGQVSLGNILKDAVSLLLFGGFYNQLRKGKQGKNVGQHHKLVEHILKFPDQIVFHQSSAEYGKYCQYAVNYHCFAAEKIFKVDLAEIVPADDCGKGKEEQTYCYKDVPDIFAADTCHCVLH